SAAPSGGTRVPVPVNRCSPGRGCRAPPLPDTRRALRRNSPTGLGTPRRLGSPPGLPIRRPANGTPTRVSTGRALVSNPALVNSPALVTTGPAPLKKPAPASTSPAHLRPRTTPTEPRTTRNLPRTIRTGRRRTHRIRLETETGLESSHG